MIKEPKCCDDCIKYIADYSSSAAFVWSVLVSRNLFDEKNYKRLRELKSFELLELLGFITTSDCGDEYEEGTIYVKLNHRKEDLSGIYYCCGKCCE